MKDPASYLLYMVNKMDDVVDLTLQLFSTIQSMCNSNPSLPYEKFTTISNIFMNWHQGRMIYILSGFIAAHLEAQQKIPFYLGEEEVNMSYITVIYKTLYGCQLEVLIAIYLIGCGYSGRSHGYC